MIFSSKLHKLVFGFALMTSLSFSLTLPATEPANIESGAILTSIKPLQLIAADITQGIIESTSLLPPGASPHQYSLRPSEVKRIHNAKSIFWVGPELELFLAKSFLAYSDKSHALSALIKQDVIKPLSAEQLLAEAAASHTEQEHLQDDGHNQSQTGHQSHAIKLHQHQYQGADPHIWLSPEQALKIAATVRDVIAAQYPQHKLRLQANYQQFVESVEAADRQLELQFGSLKGVGFLVFHDAYSRFVEHYQLNQIAALTLNPSKRPGAKHLGEIRQLIKDTQPSCIFSEPQFSGVAIESIVRNSSIKIAQLDPLAIDSNASENRYANFLEDFGRQFSDCLGS
ncbi:MAG: zinc ABC transporter substrate-binding protein ZnuA [Pseudomonadales bacterium]|nr:zinc ABC transporter substrate-binding protein ZnuA [Pseudomonadales bacterium]NRA15738.1 zinc ABC transporter substrate-binding protein ZnuA [Oceanospirillaceae bacterium]